jgi:hypothetical protein
MHVLHSCVIAQNPIVEFSPLTTQEKRQGKAQMHCTWLKFSEPAFVLVARRVYYQCLPSYWSGSHLNAARGELDTNSRLGLERKLVPCEARQQIRLAYARVANKHHLEKVVVTGRGKPLSRTTNGQPIRATTRIHIRTLLYRFRGPLQSTDESCLLREYYSPQERAS